MASPRHDASHGFATWAIAVLTVPLAILTGVVFGLQVGVAVLAVGLLLAPLPLIAGELFGVGVAESEPADPLEELKAQYVEGEIDDAEFDREIERLVGTEAAGTEAAGTKEVGTDAVNTEEVGTDAADTEGAPDDRAPDRTTEPETHRE